jgi:hypothetical protein
MKLPYIEALETELEKAAARIEELEAALRNLLQDPPSILDEPDTDAQIVIHMRKIARAALRRNSRP